MSDILCICKVCGKRTKALSALSKHITHIHHLTQQEYYDLYYKEYNEGICPCCGSETGFNRFSYRRFCSIRCNGLFTLQQTQDTVEARKEGISTSKKFKRVHSSKKIKKKISKSLTNYYKNIVEIKNPCLMAKLLQENTKDNAKYKCMMDNKVKIITDCSKYITYINTIYGENYLQSFKKDKGE